MPPTLFSWWCHRIERADLGGRYQAAQESLLASRLLLDDDRAAGRARELLLESVEAERWTDPVYGEDMGHDLASSHFARAFAAGLDCAAGELSESDLDHLAEAYAARVRRPFLGACFAGNAYLTGKRNTNWLGHIAGSAVLAELALAGRGREDRAALALAKANVLRYLEFVNPDGSLPEMGDYFYYGMEPALLALHAWRLHFGEDLLAGFARSSVRRAIDWALAFTDEGGFWADFGDCHRGWHEASRVTGYLFARHFGSPGGQWLGDRGETREPLAALMRPAGVEPAPRPQRVSWFKAEETAALRFGDRSVILRGGACRSPLENVPHRHYDTGSIIYRARGENLVCDSGFDRYDATFWDDYDGPGHPASSAELHNVPLADGRGFRHEDCARGGVVRCEELRRGFGAIIYRLSAPVPGIAAWERQVLLVESGPLCVVDQMLPDAAGTLSVIWHLHDKARAGGEGEFATSALTVRTAANRGVAAEIGEDLARSYLRLDVGAGGDGPATIITLFGSPGEVAGARVEPRRPAVHFGELTWNVRARTLEQ